MNLQSTVSEYNKGTNKNLQRGSVLCAEDPPPNKFKSSLALLMRNPQKAINELANVRNSV